MIINENSFAVVIISKVMVKHQSECPDNMHLKLELIKINR